MMPDKITRYEHKGLRAGTITLLRGSELVELVQIPDADTVDVELIITEHIDEGGVN